MQKSNYVRLLHLTDLHFGPEGRPENIDNKLGNATAETTMRGDESETFINTIMRILPEEKYLWPKVIIVTGDLVTRGGGSTELEKEASFSAAI